MKTAWRVSLRSRSPQGLAHRVDRSTHSLRAFLVQYLANYNEHAGPFTWTKGPEKLPRIIAATKAYQAIHRPDRNVTDQRIINIKH